MTLKLWFSILPWPCIWGIFKWASCSTIFSGSLGPSGKHLKGWPWHSSPLWYLVVSDLSVRLGIKFSSSVGCWVRFVFSPFFLKIIFLNVDYFLSLLLNLLQYCFCFMFWILGCKARGSSLTRNWICTPCTGRSLNLWTTREVPSIHFSFSFF